METYIVIIYNSYDDRYFVKCESLERAKKVAKAHKAGRNHVEVAIYKAEYIEHVF